MEDKSAQAKALVGTHIEIPVHYDLWARGARYGVVHSADKGGAFIRVRMDHPQVRRLVKVWRLDFDYIKQY
jgi:hypothetical protein